MKNIFQFLLIAVLSALINFTGHAQTDSALSSLPGYKGIVYSIGYWPQHSSLAGSSAPPGTCVSVGFGYMVNNHILASMKIHTGSETIPVAEFHPVSGRGLLGGAGLDLSYTFDPILKIAPFVTAGFDAYTIMKGSSGYQANGPRGTVGGRFLFANNFSLDAGITINHLRFYDTWSSVPIPAGFEEFSSTYIGFTLTITFYSNMSL